MRTSAQSSLSLSLSLSRVIVIVIVVIIVDIVVVAWKVVHLVASLARIQERERKL